MPYCSNCGQPVHAAAKFCDACGSALSGATSQAFAPVLVPLPPVSVGKTQRGGFLALKGFLLFLFLAAIGSSLATTTGDASVRNGGMLLGSGISAAYIITNIRQWKRENQTVKGANIAWTVVGFLLLICLGTLIQIGTGRNAGTAPTSQSNSTPPAQPPSQASSPPKASPPHAAAPEGNCGTGKTCSIRDNGTGGSVFVFVSEDALKEFKASSGSKDASRQEMTALVFAGQIYMVPNGTTVAVLDWSVWHGWHKVRIVSAGSHVGRVGYILDQWTAFE